MPICLIDNLFTVFDDKPIKVYNILKRMKDIYEKNGKKNLYDLFKTETYMMKNDSSIFFNKIVELELYRMAYYSSYNQYNGTWKKQDILSGNYIIDKWQMKDISGRTLSDYSETSTCVSMETEVTNQLKSLNIDNNVDPSKNTLVGYDEIVRGKRFDFEYKFSSKSFIRTMYNTIIKNIFSKVFFNFCKDNTVGTYTIEEREFIYYIISLLDDSVKKQICEMFSSFNSIESYTDEMNTFISNLQDKLCVPIEMTCSIIVFILYTRNLLIMFGSAGKIGSYEFNSNIRYNYYLDNIYSSLVSDGSTFNKSDISCALTYTYKDTIYDKYKILIATNTGIYAYNINDFKYENNSKPVITPSYPVIKLFQYGTYIIVVTTNDVKVYNSTYVEDITTYSNLPTIFSSVLKGNISFTDLLISKDKNILVVTSTIEIASYDFSTNTWAPYNTYGLTSRGLDLKTNISALKFIEYYYDITNKIKGYILCVGNENGEIFSYSVNASVWTLLDGELTSSSVTKKTVYNNDVELLNGKKIIDFFYIDSTLFIFTSAGTMASYYIYSGYFRTYEGKNLTSAGPNNFFDMATLSKLPTIYGTVNKVLYYNDGVYFGRFLLFTSTGYVLEYFVGDNYLIESKDDIGNNAIMSGNSITDAILISIKFKDSDLKSTELYTPQPYCSGSNSLFSKT